MSADPPDRDAPATSPSDTPPSDAPPADAQPPGAGAPARRRTGRSIAVVTAVGVVGMIVAVGVLVAAVRFFAGGVFGTCEHTPGVVAAVVEDLDRMSYTVEAASYQCVRGGAATVEGDRAVLWAAPPKPATSREETRASAVADLVDAGWSTPGAEGVLAQDGYSMEVDAHSSEPALVRLMLSRDDVSSSTPWDDAPGSYPERAFSDEAMLRYALIPDLTPTWAPDRFHPWAGRYEIGERDQAGQGYWGVAYTVDDGRSLRSAVVATDTNRWGNRCAEPDHCTVVGTADNGIVVHQVNPRSAGADVPDIRYGPGTHVGLVDDVVVHVCAYDMAESGSPAAQHELQDVLSVEEILAVFGSIDVDASASAR